MLYIDETGVAHLVTLYQSNELYIPCKKLGFYVWDILGCGQQTFITTPPIQSKTGTASPNYSYRVPIHMTCF